MNETFVLEISKEAIMTAIKVGGPIMLVSLVVGLTISLFQALTQIQEVTLSFVPKILAIFFALLVFLPMGGQAFMKFALNLFSYIATLQ